MSTLNITDRDGVQHQVNAKPGRTLMEVLRDADLGIAALCGGMCSCATCHVYVDQSWMSKLPERQSDETTMLEDLSTYKSTQSRLSCQILLRPEYDGLTATIAPEDY